MRAPLASGCGYPRPWPLDCTRPGSSFVQSLGFEFYHTRSCHSLLDFNLAILPGTCGAILQLWQRGAYHPSATLHHAVACHRKGWDGKAALLFYPPQGPSGRVCRMGASTTWGGCLRVFIRTPVPPGDPHSTILAFDASSIVDKSYSCHRRRLCLLARLTYPSAATTICLRTPSQVTAVTNCGLGRSKPCGWSRPACPLPSSELSVRSGAAHGVRQTPVQTPM